MKILIFIIGIAVGVLVTYYNRWFVKLMGTNSWAEKIFGGGGTYIMWQLMGVLVVVITVLYVFGGLEAIFGPIVRLFIVR